MATVKTIKPAGGGDYTTLQAWEDWADGESSADQWAECYAGDCGSVSISGWTATPDATTYPKIYSDSSAKPNADPSDTTDGAYIDGHIYLYENYTHVEDMRINADLSASDAIGIYISSYLARSCVIQRNIIYGFNGYNDLRGIWFYARNGYSYTSNIYIYNNIISSDGPYSYYSVGISIHNRKYAGVSATYNAYIYNNTIYYLTGRTNAYYGCYFFETEESANVTINIYAKNSIGSYYRTPSDWKWGYRNAGTANYYTDYNLSSDATADDGGGTNCVINEAYGDTFVDPANGDLSLKTGSGAIGGGYNLYSDFTTDYNGDERPASGSWDMGALTTYVASSGGGIPPHLLQMAG